MLITMQFGLQAVKNGGSLQKIGMLLYHLASKTKVQISKFIPVVVKYIVQDKIDSQLRIDGMKKSVSTI